MDAPPTGSSKSTGTQTTSGGGAFSGGATYVIYGTMRANNGKYYNAGSTTITMPAGRPSNFSWTYAGIDSSGTWLTGSSKSSGLEFLVTANEWNAFAAKCNLFRQYKGLGSYGFTDAYSGMSFMYYMFNQGVTCISSMSPSISPPSTVVAGQSIYASYLNGLMNSLNSIT